MPDDARRPDAEALSRYEEDAALWAVQQAALIRAGRWDALDAENIAEEIESLAKTEFRVLVSALRVALMHMLKWDHQRERRSRSWALSIANGRTGAREQLDENPSFRPRLPEAIERAYRLARREAAIETGLPLRTFPETCPYTAEEILERPHGDED